MPDHRSRDLPPEVRYTFTTRDRAPDWQVRRVHLTEALSEPYRLTVELVSDDPGLDPDVLLGAEARLVLTRADAPSRAVMGVILRVEQLAHRGGPQALRLEIGPALALLAHEVDTRAWQRASVPEIVADVLEHKLSGLGRRLRLDLDLTYLPREYCVQYRESTLDFILRLLHDEGINLRFDHDLHADSETLVLFDASDRCPSRGPVGFRPRETGESIHRLDRARHLGPTGVTQSDWVPLAAAEAPFIHTHLTRDERGRECIIHEHDDHRRDGDDDGAHARRKLDQRTVLHDTCRGAGDIVGFTPGLRFELQGRGYLLLRVEHHGEDPEADRLGEDISANAPRYTNHFLCIPDTVPVRPQLDERLRRPRAHGPHTAIVVGPESEEIHTDEHGRIKLRFHWDRPGLDDERASCWVRVAQTWAGAGWGALFIPRVGMEVLVEFLDGDPDRPLVVGCVYNSLNTPPVALPDDKTCSALTSESSPGGGLANQIRLEDGRGRESLTLKTRRDLHASAGHDHTVTIARDQTIKVGENQTTFVGANQRTAVTGDVDLTISDGDHTTTVVAGSHLLDIHRDHTQVLRTGNHRVAVELGEHKTVARDRVQLASREANLHLQAKTSLHAECQAGDILLDADRELRARSTTAAISLAAATRLELRAATGAVEIRGHTDLRLCAVTGGLTATAGGDFEATAGGDLKATADGAAELRAAKISLVASDVLELRVGPTAIVLKPGSIELSSPAIASKALGEHTISGALIRLN